MGNHHSHEDAAEGPSRSRSGSRRLSSPRRGSRAEPDQPEKPPPPSMVPVEKLAKMLAQRSQKEDGVNGITEKIFTKYVFPLYPELSRRFFRHLRAGAGAATGGSAGAAPGGSAGAAPGGSAGAAPGGSAGAAPGGPQLSVATFRVQAERVLAMMEDDAIRDTYVRMFGCSEEEMVTAEGFLSLLMVCHQLSMDHCPGGKRKCPMVLETLGAVVSGCFGSAPAHSAGFVARWLSVHCQRLLLPLHRYCVHMLATLHRTLESCEGERQESECEGVQLASPVLEPGPGGGSKLLPMSAACLLAAAAPPLYSRPLQLAPSHTGSLPMSVWLSRLVSLAPSHWAPLYCSAEHGQGANRFLHHTLAYRGPTIVLFSGGDLVVVVLAPVEWRETHRYWGTADTALIQLRPHFNVVERAANMLYLNLSIRGYPLGLRAGSDPRSPLLNVSDTFDTFSFQGTQHPLDSIEVWGCGDASLVQHQQEVKKWIVKEAERHREVKLSPADWMEHPDRYLLELAGRPQYNTSGS